MTSKDSALRLDKELGIIEKIVPTSIPEILPNIVEVSGDDIEDDYKYQRDVTNALFVGSTKELQKMLKDNIEDENT